MLMSSGGVGNLWLQIPTCLQIYTTSSIYIGARWWIWNGPL